jgi:hypothetical protein
MRGTGRPSTTGSSDAAPGYGGSWTNPAAVKSPSNANASRMPRCHIKTKLVASTKEVLPLVVSAQQRQCVSLYILGHELDV